MKENKKQELSIYRIAKSIESRWEATARALECLKEMGLVSERLGEREPLPERLFRLSN